VYIEYNYAIKQQIIDAAYFPSQKMVSNTHAHAPAHTHTRAHFVKAMTVPYLQMHSLLFSCFGELNKWLRKITSPTERLAIKLGHVLKDVARMRSRGHAPSRSQIHR